MTVNGEILSYAEQKVVTWKKMKYIIPPKEFERRVNLSFLYIYDILLLFIDSKVDIDDVCVQDGSSKQGVAIVNLMWYSCILHKNPN